jgi:hypothetical protein
MLRHQFKDHPQPFVRLRPCSSHSRCIPHYRRAIRRAGSDPVARPVASPRKMRPGNGLSVRRRLLWPLKILFISTFHFRWRPSLFVWALLADWTGDIRRTPACAPCPSPIVGEVLARPGRAGRSALHAGRRLGSELAICETCATGASWFAAGRHFVSLRCLLSAERVFPSFSASEG